VTGTALTVAERTSLGMPRDLNGDGTDTTANVVTYDSTRRVVLVPMRVQLTWISGSGGDAGNSRQSLTVHAIFSAQH
jgi:hypothetical protein